MGVDLRSARVASFAEPSPPRFSSSAGDQKMRPWQRARPALRLYEGASDSQNEESLNSATVGIISLLTLHPWQDNGNITRITW